MKLLVIILLLIASRVDATVYHVKLSGGTTGNCSTAVGSSDPGIYIRTIAAALACKDPAVAGSGAGHTVRIYTGVYTEAINNIIPGGTSWTNPFTIEKNPGDVVEIRPSSCSALIVIDVRRANSKYFQIKGTSWSDKMKITAGNGTCSNDAIKFATSTSLGSTTFGRLQFLEITGSLNHGVQFTASSTNNEVKDNYIHHNGSTLNVDDTHGAYVHSPDNLFEGNIFESNCNRGLQIYNSGSNNAHRNIVRRNIFRLNGTCEDAAGAVVSSGNNQQVYGNFFYNNTSHGLSISQNNPVGTLIYNNTFYNNGDSAINILAGGTNTVIRNNIMRNNAATVTDAGTGTVQTDTITSDPLFVNAAAGDLCVNIGSPVINEGLAAIATGVTRTANGLPDVGACETFGHSSAVASGNTIEVTFGMNLNTPILPATGITGFTVNNGRTVTSAVRKTGSDSVVQLTISGAACIAGQTWTYSYSGGNVTDSALIGGTKNQPLHAITNQAVTNNCDGAAVSGTFTQVAYQGYLLYKDSDGNLIKLPYPTSTPNAPIFVTDGATLSLDIQTNCDNVADCEPLGQTLQYDINSSALWSAVTDICGTVCFYGTSDINSALPEGEPTCPLTGALTCVSGGTQNIAAAVPVIDMAQNNSTVNKYLIRVQPGFNTLRFRLINQNGSVLNYNSEAYPTITGIPALAGVGM